MSAAAAMLLAAALVAAPAPPRRRIGLKSTRLPVKRPVLVVFTGAAVLLLSPTVVLATGILGATMVARRRRSLRARQHNTDGQALAAALDILVGELRVGAHPVRAFAVAASECDGPVGASLRAVAARAGLGADVAGGMRAVAAQSTVAEQWNRLAVCWQLAAEHGLAMSALMRAAQRDIVERQRFTARVEAGLAGARATAVILAGLPVLGVLLGQLIGAQPIAFLAGRGIGGILLVAGTVLICLGLLWADRITERTLT